jgi:hypothetical protein
LIVFIENTFCGFACVFSFTNSTHWIFGWAEVLVQLISDDARFLNIIAVSGFALLVDLSFDGPLNAINVAFALLSTRAIVKSVNTFSSLEIAGVSGANRSIITRKSRTIANDLPSRIF